MGRRIAGAASLAILGATLWLFYSQAATSGRGGAETPLYSARRCDPYGTAALLEVLRERGIDARTLDTPRIDAGERGAVIQVLALPVKEKGSRSSALPELDIQTLESWMAKGNTVIQLTRGYTSLMKRCNVPRPEGVKAPLEWNAIERSEADGKPPAELHAEGVNAGGLYLLLPAEFGESEIPGWRPIAKSDGRIVAGEMRVGEGRLIVVGAPTPALNGWIGKARNLEFLTHSAGKGRVFIDDWSHGVGQGETFIRILHKAGLVPVILQLVFVIFLYHWSVRGQVRLESFPPERRRSSAEQIETLGYLYSKALSASEAQRRARDESLRRLAAELRVKAGEVQARLPSLKPERAKQVQDFLDLLKPGAAANPSILLTQSHKLSKAIAHDRSSS